MMIRVVKMICRVARVAKRVGEGPMKHILPWLLPQSFSSCSSSAFKTQFNKIIIQQSPGSLSFITAGRHDFLFSMCKNWCDDVNNFASLQMVIFNVRSDLQKSTYEEEFWAFPSFVFVFPVFKIVGDNALIFSFCRHVFTQRKPDHMTRLGLTHSFIAITTDIMWLVLYEKRWPGKSWAKWEPKKNRFISTLFLGNFLPEPFSSPFFYIFRKKSGAAHE